jgi:predicted Zn finger-like uncharacterized protein
MNVVCAQCNATYNIPDNKLPAKKATAKCKQCSGRIVIEPGSPPPAKERLEVDYDFQARQPRQTPKENPAISGHPGTLLNEYPQLGDYSPASYAFKDILALNKNGNFKSRRNDLKLKMLQAVKSVLDNVLRKEEVVLRVAGGTAYYPAEIFFGNGWMTMLYNRYVIIATNLRVLMINTNHRMTKPAHYLFQMTYNEIKKVGRGLFRTSLVLERKKGKRRVFSAVKAFLGSEMQTLIRSQIDPLEPVNLSVATYENLCPSCYQPLPKRLERCTHCRAQFKTPKKAMLRSLLLPGWGDIYLGHRVLGTFELLGSLFIWLIVFSSLRSMQIDALIPWLFLLLVYNGIDSILTYVMAQKGYSLEKRRTPLNVATAHSKNPVPKFS